MIVCDDDDDPRTGEIIAGSPFVDILTAIKTSTRLNENDRIIEIAKMLEGNNASKSAYTHAKQLLN